jgi:DNA-directed RNA polymerase specialized sigma24 family protein
MGIIVRERDPLRLMSLEVFMKMKSSRFDRLVAQYYPAVYSFAARFTDDAREAVALTRDAFNNARKQAQDLRNPTAIALVLISAVIRAGLAPA